MKSARTALLLLPFLALAACTSPSQRITRNLVDLGVSERQARCMGDRLGDRLSVGQLRRLQELSNISTERLSRMRIGEIARKLSDDKDPGLVAEFLRAGIGCAI
ncbi:hypothetical protein [Sandarakinorhabdus sp.]|uniref:hypothetical protein n=1 Tax=Sandarakinorhabdus sp. TaxID=1916663 RepID=UPI00286D75CF|nr:hypothetical protein [Sandarakinorhabdus sp.]